MKSFRGLGLDRLAPSALQLSSIFIRLASRDQGRKSADFGDAMLREMRTDGLACFPHLGIQCLPLLFQRLDQSLVESYIEKPSQNFRPFVALRDQKFAKLALGQEDDLPELRSLVAEDFADFLRAQSHALCKEISSIVRA